MRQSPVGEPAATAAANFATPQRRNSAKRFCLVRHCRQRYKQSSTDPRFEVREDSRSLAEAEVAAPSHDVWLQLFDQLLQTEPPCPACHVSDPPLELVERLWRDAPLAPVIRDAEPKKLALATALFASLTLSRSLLVKNQLTEAMIRSPASLRRRKKGGPFHKSARMPRSSNARTL